MLFCKFCNICIITLKKCIEMKESLEKMNTAKEANNNLPKML